MPIAQDVLQVYKLLMYQETSHICEMENHLLNLMRDAARELKVVREDNLQLRINTRKKEIDKVAEKVDRADRKWVKGEYGDTIDSFDWLKEEIKDLVAGKIVLDYLSDARNVVDYIERKSKENGWRVLDIAENLDKPKDNGYRSHHLTLKMRMHDKKYAYGEIQIKTYHQESWAVKTHDLTYKPPGSVPDHITAILRHLSDCLYTTDNEFEICKQYLVNSWSSTKSKP